MSTHKRSSGKIMMLLGLLLVLAVSATAIGAAPAPTVADPLVGEQVERMVSLERESYIVIMEGMPLAAYDGGVNGIAATKPDAGNKLDTNSPNAQLYRAHLQAQQANVMKSAGISGEDQLHSYTVALNGFAAIMTADQAKALESQEGVLRVLEDEMRQKTTDSSPGFLGLTKKGSLWLRGYDGEGVVVGVIDSGIWPEHPSFADDGSYAAPAVSIGACDFGNMAHNVNDAPFTCNNKLIGARQMLDTYRALIGADPDEFDSARDDDGHGTHTASTAAGNAGVEASVLGIPRGTISGIAPRAYVVAYKGLGNLGGFGSDLAAAIDQAVADGVDVINYSVGGGPSLTGADDLAYLFAADAGVFVATSAGNSGPGAGTVGGPGSVPWLTTVAASTQKRSFEGSASSSDGWEFPGVSITAGTDELPLVDAEDAGDELCNPGTLDPGVVAGKLVLCKRGAIARVAKSEAVYLAGGAGMILYNADDGQSQVSDTHWVPSVHTNYTDGAVIKAYIDSAGAGAVAQINGGTATKVKAPIMAAFSSRGSNVVAEDIIKPDITAPGVQILAGGSPFPDPGNVPGELYQAIAGTSMSSPHIAGIFALVKQAHPEWSPAMAKSAIMTTAYQKVKKEDGKTNADPFDFGAGHVNPSGLRGKLSLLEPGLVYDAGFFEYLGFLCDAEPEALSPSTCPDLESIGIPTDASDLNLPSIGVAELAGSQTVVRTVTAQLSEKDAAKGKTVKFKAKVKAPKGYKVTVVPKQIALKHGESATFEVTITNKNAPIGEWRFGSLTWKGKSYQVFSPIAVRGALFDAPGAVEGSGASGSASFDVLFGYDGSYAAAPHGLSADAPTNGDIGQDPDQTYPSGDDAPGPTGGVDKISFPVSGAAFARWELVIAGDDDIDLFLEDSGGNIIAASTNGGTDELIELFLPADDTYTLVVHGWSVPNEPLPYTLHYWAVPLASGGSLSVDSAPTAANLGATGTVDISWSGLAAGSYLGAVSHTGDVGLMGLTLVEVAVP